MTIPADTRSTSKSRYGRRPEEMVPRRQIPKSMTVSVILLIAVFAFIIGFIVALSIFVGRPTTPQPPRPPTQEVTSTACHVIGNETTCFRFATKLAAGLCSAVGGVAININKSSSTPSAATSTVCYHNVCREYVVDNRFCFLNRSNLVFTDCPTELHRRQYSN